MLKLTRLNDDEYIIMANKRAIYGSLTKTAIALSHLDVQWSEIEEALVSLQLNDHDIAEFGINRLFIFSMKISS